MTESDIEDAVELISRAMDNNEALWAQETMENYFACKKQGFNTGREYYIWRHEWKIRGLVGLHSYIWGPKENVWLSWFAVDPAYQKKGIGSALMVSIEKRAKQAGYEKFFIETYDNPTFRKAISFYKSAGFSELGRINNYLPDGSAMIVFGKNIP